MQIRSNIIWIIADDLGYGDLSVYGNRELNTPHLDALAKEGVQFTQAYATAPICAPSREAILTGRYQQRFGGEFMPYEHFQPQYIRKIKWHYPQYRERYPGLKALNRHSRANAKNFKNGLNPQEITMAALLKAQGYKTALVGKWNEGFGEGYFPDERGFDYNYSFSGALTRYLDENADTSAYRSQRLPWAFSDLPAWAPRYGTSAILDGREEVRDTGYLTFSLARKAIDFIERQKNQPFFLTLAFNAPHDPFQAPVTYMNRVLHIKDPVQRIYYAMILAMDDAVGLLMEKLRTEGLAGNTVIFFISDNGAATYTRATDNAPLRGGKCTHFEGGLKVPFILYYPASGKQPMVYDKPVSALDMFATTAAICQVTLPENRIYDGINLLPFLSSPQAAGPHKWLFWRNGYSKAVRKENWKLVVNDKSKFTYLFNLENDPGESRDLSKKEPEILQELTEALKTWEQTQTIKPAWPSAADIKIDVNGLRYYFPS